MLDFRKLVVWAGAAVVLVACGGGGGGGGGAVDSPPAVNPLAKYVGTHSNCIDHELKRATIAESGATAVTIEERSDYYQSADCTGFILATETMSAKITADFDATATASVTGHPYWKSTTALSVDKVRLSVPAFNVSVTGTGVYLSAGLPCVRYSSTRELCWNQVTYTAPQSMTGGLAVDGAVLLTLSTSTAGYDVEDAYAKDGSASANKGVEGIWGASVPSGGVALYVVTASGNASFMRLTSTGNFSEIRQGRLFASVAAVSGSMDALTVTSSAWTRAARDFVAEMSTATELTDLTTFAPTTTSWFLQRAYYGQQALLTNVAGSYSFNSSYGIVSGSTAHLKAALAVTAAGEISGFYGSTSQSNGACTVTGTLVPDSSSFAIFRVTVRVAPYLGSTACPVRVATDFAGLAIYNSNNNAMYLSAVTAAGDAGIGLVFAGKL